MADNSYRKIVVFLALTFGLSSIFYYLIISTGSTQAAGGLYLLGLMWSPAVAALVTQFIFQQSFRGLGWQLPSKKYLAVGYLLPLGYGAITYLIVWLTGLGGFSPQHLAETIGPQIGYRPASPELFTIIYFLISATVLMIPSAISALGEEIGWRGLLVPELAKTMTFTQTALLSGVIWTLWHLPLILFADYNNEAPAWFAVACFALIVIGFSVVMAWLRLKSGSLWAAVLLHASHNVFIKNVFTPLTSDTGPTPYIIDEFGIALTIMLGLLALYFWRRRGELPAQPSGLTPPEPVAAQSGRA